MTVVDEISEIANKWAELGMEIPGPALLGVDKMRQLMEEMRSNLNHRPGMDEHFATRTIFQIYTAQGPVAINVSSKISPNHCSIGRMTLNDIIIEDILLDDEEFTGFNDIN